MSHPAHKLHDEKRTFGQRLADRAAAEIGSWRFLIAQTVLFAVWIALNALMVALRWDPYPFILLNLCLSFQAAYTGPVLLLSQNRQEQRDRLQAAHDFRINKASAEALCSLLDAKERGRLRRALADMESDEIGETTSSDGGQW